MRLFSQYRGLRREMYVVFFGRIVTNMGALVLPMMTLILKNKMGMTATQVAALLLLFGLIQLPCTLLGGKLADRFNKRGVIIAFDLVTVASYLVCSLLPMGSACVWLMFVAGAFAQMEWPSYDALVADLSSSEERERAYSLNYLGANVGMVLGPTLGGFLFAEHLDLAFFISALATFSSTALIFFLMRDVTPSAQRSRASAAYETGQDGRTLWAVMRQKKVLLLFLLCSGIAQLVYSQFNFLLPLNMEQLYGENGAMWFGLLTSVNAAVVIVGTPLVTRYFSGVRDVGKIVIGETLIALGFAMYVFVQGVIPLYFVSMAVFTAGEVFTTLGRQPYLTRRVPMSHRGRFASALVVTGGAFQLYGQQAVGRLADIWPMRWVWALVAAAGLANVGLYLLLKRRDRRAFGLLYTGDPIR